MTQTNSPPGSLPASESVCFLKKLDDG